MNNLNQIISHFSITGTVADVKPLGNGLINDTYKITTAEADAPDYVLQRINDSIFTDVDLLQHNIEEVTTHIRELPGAVETTQSSSDMLTRKLRLRDVRE